MLKRLKTIILVSLALSGGIVYAAPISAQTLEKALYAVRDNKYYAVIDRNGELFTSIPKEGLGDYDGSKSQNKDLRFISPTGGVFTLLSGVRTEIQKISLDS